MPRRFAKRPEIFAYISTDNTRVIHFTRHKTRLAAEKHYGNLQRRYRGSSSTDFYLTIYDGREELEQDLGADYEINYDEKTITPRHG